MRPVPLVTLPCDERTDRRHAVVADAFSGDHEFDLGLLARAPTASLRRRGEPARPPRRRPALSDRVNRVERRHQRHAPAEFTLVGTMNPKKATSGPSSRPVRAPTTVTGCSGPRRPRRIIDQALDDTRNPEFGRPPDATPASAAMPGTASATSYSNAPPRGHRGTLPGRRRRRSSRRHRDSADRTSARRTRRPRPRRGERRRDRGTLRAPHRLRAQPFEDAPT